MTGPGISHFSSDKPGLVFPAEPGVQEKDSRVGLEHHLFHQILLTKANPKVSPDSRLEETGPISSWGDLEIRIAKSIDTGEASDSGHLCNQPTTRCNHQIDEKCYYNPDIESDTLQDSVRD